MKLIITAGGTRERIDTVRTIANEATGRLGSLTAEEFSRCLAGLEHVIYFLHGAGSALPNTSDSRIKPILTEDTEQLQSELLRLLRQERIDAVIHSMAVSDYRAAALSSSERLAARLSRKLQKAGSIPDEKELEAILLEAIRETAADPGQKISSGLFHPILLLERTPKIIGLIKRTSPKTLLVGFKLLSGVSEEKLLETASGLMNENGCDFVLANDTDSVRAGVHTGYLMEKGGYYKKYAGKAEIAKGIADSVIAALTEVTE